MPGIELTDSFEDADVIFVVDLHHRNLYADILARPEHVQNYHKLICYYEHEFPPDLVPGLYTCGSMQRSATRGAPFYFWLQDHRFHADKDGIQDRPFLFSFMGRNCNAVRSQILKLDVADPTIPHLIEDTTKSFPLFNAVKTVDKQAMQDQRSRYFEVLSQTKFVLAPKGTGLSSIRQYEAMACGCVPVVLADNLRQPMGIDWEKCIVQVPESEVERIPALLKELEPRFPEMSRSAMEAYQALSEPDSFWRHTAGALLDIFENDMDKRASLGALRRAIAIRSLRGSIYRRKNDLKRLVALIRQDYRRGLV